MKFEVDQQTLSDLEIFDTDKDKKSVFALFNFTQCIGGKRKLQSYLASPTSDLHEINERKEAVLYLQKNCLDGIYIDRDALGFTEYYLRNAHYRIKSPSRFAVMGKLLDIIDPNNDYYVVEKGVSSAVKLLNKLYDFSAQFKQDIDKPSFPKLLARNCKEVTRVFSHPEFSPIVGMKKVNAYDTEKLDFLFRHVDKKSVYALLEQIYEYDALFSIIKATQEHHLNYADMVQADEHCFEVKHLFHPFVSHAVANDIGFDKDTNILFVTGPNMAGKSTFLKALGLAVYLSHAGLPVPAEKMKLSVLSGLCTTINISDSLSTGHSHFYAEVVRIKNIAEKLSADKNMFVIFDELFRGTNVKDAFDGTLAIVSAFVNIKNSFFVVSTHIVEVANKLENNNQIQFSYFDVNIENNQPVYTYRLMQGVSDVRLGMYIINSEKIIEIIERAASSSATNNKKNETI